MAKNINDKGFSPIAVVIVLVVVAIVGFVGYKVYTNSKNNQVSVSGTTGNSSVSVPPAPTITTAADLDKATATLNQVDPSSSNASDTTQLNSLANF